MCRKCPYWWRKCRIGAQGTEGYAEVHTGSGWRAVTKKASSPVPAAWTTTTTWRHTSRRWRIGWTTNESRIRCASSAHTRDSKSCLALYRSVIDGGQIALPLTSGMDELAGLRAKVPDRKVLMTLADSAKEYKD